MRKNDVDIPNKKENDGNVNDWLSGGTIGQKGAVLVFRSCVLAEKKSNEAPTKTIGSNTGNTILLKKAQNMAKRLAADPGALPFEAHVRSRNLMHDVIETFGSCEMTSTNAYIVRHMSDDELSRVESVEEQGHEVYGCCIKDVAVLPNKLCNNKFKKPADHDKDEKNHKKTKANTKSIVPITPYYASPAMNVKVLDSARMPSRVLNITYKLVNTETKLLHKLLQAHGLREAAADSKDFNLMWSGTHPKPDVLRSLMPFQRVNRLPRSYELTRKDKLFKNIEKMQYFRGVKHFDFIPNTFLMPSEFNELCSTHYRTKGPWIVKPAASCCGRGIYIVNNPDQIPKDENVVVAKYIDRPLLIGGHKCDLRLYVCVTSVDPLLIYLYEEGLVRFATVKYDTSNKNLWNPCMHLCNYSINKYHTDYIKCTDPNVGDIGHKWTLSALLRHLREAGLNTIGLMADIEDLIVKSILSSAHTIASAARAFMPYWFNCFELFGFDILIDENLKPWLLEINLSPSLACESPLDARIKSSMLADTLTLVGLPAASMFSDKIAVPKSKTAAPDNSNSSIKRQQNQNDYSADGATMRKNGAAVSGTGYCSLPYLTGDDNRLVRAVKAQYTRKGGYVRIFPSQNSWQKYSQFLDPVTGIPIYSSTLNYNIPYHGISHNYNLLIHTQLIPHFQDSVSNGTEQSPQRLKRYEVVSVAAAAPAVSLSDPTMSLRDARQAKELVKHQLREGLKLTTGEVRRAFGLYLTHVLKRISSPHNDVNATHAQLVLRFLGRAASTLRMPYNVKGPPAKICDKDRYAIISKLLNDFLFKYYKETDLFTDTEDREGCISNINFAAFLYSASEADLEDVLLLILRLENFNTVFLGDTRNQYCIDLPPSRLAVSDPPTRHTLLRHLASVTPFNVRKYRPICYNNEAFRRQQGMMLKHKEQPVTPVYNMSYFQTMYN